ncbi:T9SS type A sorting domain-containing protein [Candidatus Poribacteria bacterium]
MREIRRALQIEYRIVVISLFFLAIAGSAQTATINVPGVYPTIQQGIDAARNGDTVIVADGTYRGVGNKDLDFQGKVITVRSENGPEYTVIDCEGSGRGFLFHSGETSGSVVSGFTIENGSPGGNLVQIAIDTITDEKMVTVNVQKDSSRPENDGDVAIEPGEIIRLDIILKNSSGSAQYSVKGTLKTDDPRVTGLVPVLNGAQVIGWNPVNMAEVGISSDYGAMFENTTRFASLQFVGINEDFAPPGDTVRFILEIRSGGTIVGVDEFHVKVGADIAVDEFDVNRELKPGNGPEDIDLRLRNMTETTIEDIRVEIDPDSRDIDIDEDSVDIDRIYAGRTGTESFETVIAADFRGYATFTVSVIVDGRLVNIESFSHYFGMRTEYIMCWVDDNDNNIAEPGEAVEFQIARWNPTDMEAENVRCVFGTTDAAILSVLQGFGDYDDILPGGAAESDDDYEFTVADESNSVFVTDSDFETQGRTVEFTLDVEEDADPVGVETLTTRIGGMVRYLAPEGFDDLMSTINDHESLGPNNNGNGRPEPGETIEILVSLINIWDNNIYDVSAKLDSDDDVDVIIDEVEYDRIRDDSEESGTFLLEIDDDFEGNQIAFELEISGEISGVDKDLGMDVFRIPVWNDPAEAGISFQPVAVAGDTDLLNASAIDSYGGGIRCTDSSSPTIDSNIIIGNLVGINGGGISCEDNSNPVIINNVIVRNIAVSGGGISCANGSAPTLINNTISENSAETGGGGIDCRDSSLPEGLNNVLWADSPIEIFVDSGSGMDITYSDIQGGWPGAGNISANPVFVNAASNDYQLTNNSPCIGKGITGQNVPSIDIKGNDRPEPSGSNPDMGAYESSLPVLGPTITSVSPSNILQGTADQDLTINGTNLLSGATVSFTGDGITLNSLAFVGSTELTANISVASDASVGFRSITVTNPDGQVYTGVNMLTIGNVISGAGGVTVGIEAKRIVSNGESFSASITVEGVADLMGFQLDVTFDPAMFEAIQVNTGALFSDSSAVFCLGGQIDNNTGTVAGIACARIDGGTVGGSGVLTIIEFRAIGVGNGQIGLQNVKLSDPNANGIPVVVTDITIAVTGSPPWDVNKDGIVDPSDLVAVAERFGEIITQPVIPNPDVNGDGIVDIFDIILVIQHFGETYSPAAPSRDIWSVDPQHIPALTRIYNIMEENRSSEPAIRDAKEFLHRLISNAKVTRTEAFQNYPNPFNPDTWIPFQLTTGSEVEVRIYSSAGQLVRVLDLGYRQPGYYTSRTDSAHWNGLDEGGEAVSSGVYFYTIQAGEFAITKKMVVAR